MGWGGMTVGGWRTRLGWAGGWKAAFGFGLMEKGMGGSGFGNAEVFPARLWLKPYI